MKGESAYIMKSDRQMFCQSGGCTAKLGPGALSHVLEKLPRKQDPDLLWDMITPDDAAVYRISDTTALVQTLDFFSSDGGGPLSVRADSGGQCPQ